MHARHEEFTVDTQGDGDVIDVTAASAEGDRQLGTPRRPLHRVRRPLDVRRDHDRVRAGLQRRPEPGARRRRARSRPVGAQRAERRHQRAQPRAGGHDRAVGRRAVHRTASSASGLAEDRLHRLRRPAAVTTAGRAAARRLSPARSIASPDASAPPARHALDALVEHVFLFDLEVAADRVVVERAGPAGRDHVEAGEVAARTTAIPVAHGPEMYVLFG